MVRTCDASRRACGTSSSFHESASVVPTRRTEPAHCGRASFHVRADQVASPARVRPTSGNPVICSTNAIESLNARYRRAIRARGHFPNEQAALKCLYLVTRSLDPTGTGRARWTMRWKPALNAFAITFADRFPAAEDY